MRVVADEEVQPRSSPCSQQHPRQDLERARHRRVVVQSHHALPALETGSGIYSKKDTFYLCWSWTRGWGWGRASREGAGVEWREKGGEGGGRAGGSGGGREGG